MRIGELAARSGLATSRIRFYESIGLLQADRRPNGYRSYSRDVLTMLNLIASAQKAGFSLDEIRALLPGDLSNWQHETLIVALRAKVDEIAAMEARLAQSKAHLLAIIREIEESPEGVDCAENTQRLLSQIAKGEMGTPSLGRDDLKDRGARRAAS
ncbi:MerR family transcriptional regulator [Paracoccus aminophilus]|uniref:Transcriptional regulator, MerR family n=2 Tax=Paracoccus aminophilus TaxID=34003 RepID=S5YZQ6_PARAH|nr:MerR family transcriptional regulator [Paracoccus aminophilus]AGT10691.1 transcriptional regulator, MerR family [Paracoccus aminophilus JCM 7686]